MGLLGVEGETLMLVEWAEKLGARHTTILMRLRNGWSEQDAVTKPLRRFG